MTWRVQLPQPFIRQIDLLSADKTIVAVWTQIDRVHFYDQRNGSSLGERVIEKLATHDRQDERWRTFVTGLTAPNQVFLPQVRVSGVNIRSSEDGRTRLYQLGESGLGLEVSGKESPLELQAVGPIVSIAFDTVQGALAVLDAKGKVYLFQQRLQVSAFETGFAAIEDFTPLVLISQAGKRLLVTDGQMLSVFEANGKLRKKIELHYPLGSCVWSPDGSIIATSDGETGVIRLYNGEDLYPTYQRFAIDLAADARRLNASSGAQPATVTPGAIAVSNRGVIAFSLGGLLCVSSSSKMRAVPTPASIR